jgi:transcription elongation factor Elf1
MKLKTINYCPKCNHKLDAATNFVDDKIKPKIGDYSICIECNCILQFAKKNKLILVDIYSLPLEDFNKLTNLRERMKVAKEYYRSLN